MSDKADRLATRETLSSLPIGQQVILIELDALLDTRLAVAESIAEGALNEIARHPGYHVRNTDDLSQFTDKFTREEYYDAWDNRTKESIKDVLMTEYVFEMAKLSMDLHRAMADGNDPLVQKAEIKINLYPYKFNDVEKTAIVDALKQYVMPGIELSTCSLPPNLLNFEYIRRNFTSLVVYNFREWMAKCEREDYNGPGAPQVSMAVPALFGRDGVVPDDVLKKALQTDKDVDPDLGFGLTEYVMSAVLTLIMRDPIFFSIITPKRK